MSQIKSRERVKDRGEVFTNRREIVNMLDLVKDESYNVDSTFLEPACGTGNFLVVILERKLETLGEEASEINKVKALSKIYGVDICPENIKESQDRLFNMLNLKNNENRNLAKLILDKNIMVNNFLEDNIEFCSFDFEKREFDIFLLDDMTEGKNEKIRTEKF